MEEQKRITPEQVVQAMKEHGLKAARGSLWKCLDGNDCACGLGAVYFSLREEDYDVQDPAYAKIREDLTKEYMWDFIYGFDGSIIRNDSVGFQDGEAAWKACIAEGLVYKL